MSKPLTARELQIVKLAWKGLKNREIAERLTLSIKTVEMYRSRAMRKYGVANAVQLFRALIREGVLKRN